MKIRLLTLATLFGLAITAQAQSSKVDYFSSSDIQSQLASLGAKAKGPAGTAGTVLGDYGNHNVRLSVRTSSGGAEIHAHFNDVIIVTQGEATLITGGKAIAPKTIAEGEQVGTGIEGGKVQHISKGDIIHIPVETPHQMKIAPGTLFSCIVVKVKQP